MRLLGRKKADARYRAIQNEQTINSLIASTEEEEENIRKKLVSL